MRPPPNGNTQRVARQLIAVELQVEIDVERVGVRLVGGHLRADRDRRVAVVLRVDLQGPLDGGVGAVGGDDRVAVAPSRRS